MAAAQSFYHPTPISKKLTEEMERDEEAHYNKCCCCHVSRGLLIIGAFELFLLILTMAGIVATYVLIEIPGLGVSSDLQNDTQQLFLPEGSEEFVTSTILSSLIPTTRGPYGSVYGDYNWVYAQSPLASLCVGVGAAVVGITVVILMMIGVRKFNARLLIPHMVAQVLAVLALFAGSALFIFAAVTVSTSPACAQTKQGDACTKVLLSFGAFIVVFTLFAGVQIYFLIMTIRGYRYIKEKCQRIRATTSPYYAMYQQRQREYQQTLQHQHHQQHRQQLAQQQQAQQAQGQQGQQNQSQSQPQAQAQQQQDQPSPTAAQQQPQQPPMNPAAAYMYQQQPVYATYAQPYGMAAYNYGYRYA